MSVVGRALTPDLLASTLPTSLSRRYVENGGDQDAEPLVLTLPLTGHDIDTSFYSRLRKQSDETSGTVMG